MGIFKCWNKCAVLPLRGNVKKWHYSKREDSQRSINFAFWGHYAATVEREKWTEPSISISYMHFLEPANIYMACSGLQLFTWKDLKLDVNITGDRDKKSECIRLALTLIFPTAAHVAFRNRNNNIMLKYPNNSKLVWMGLYSRIK